MERTTTTTTGDLEHAGFTAREIAQLESLRDVYPIIEMVDSTEQLQRLMFLKWLHGNRGASHEDAFAA
jgi:hypothetical protein